MIKYRWYRAIRVLFGARSFFKATNYPDVTYVLIKGSSMNTKKVVDSMLESGYIEEFV